jgi:hypothetical protein
MTGNFECSSEGWVGKRNSRLPTLPSIASIIVILSVTKWSEESKTNRLDLVGQ